MSKPISGEQVYDKPESNLSSSVASGFSWTGLSLIGRQVFQFVILAVLTRLLTPSDFGLIALVLVIIDFVAIFNGELGFAEAIIQRKELHQQHLYSVFWLNIVIGCLLGLIIFASAPIIARFYQEPSLVPIARVLAFNFPIYALRTVPLSLLRRQMNFKQLGIIELLSVLAGGITALVLAYNGFGVWSLAWQTMVTMFVTVISLWIVVNWRPKLQINKQSISELWNFSSNMIGFYAWEYWTQRGDNLLIGKLLGSISLGYYTRAYTNALIPYQISLVARRVMLPALSKVQDDKDAVRSLYLNALSFIVMIAAPILFGLAAIADNFVLLIYTSKWLPIVPAMRWLCIVGFFLTIGSTVDVIYQSQNRTDLLFKWGVISGIAAIASFAFGAWLNTIEAVAGSYAITLVFLSYWNFTIPGRLINLKFIDVLKVIDGFVICAAVMAIAVYGFGLVTIEIALLARFLIQVVLGILLYLLLLIVVERNKMKQFFALIQQFVNAKN